MRDRLDFARDGADWPNRDASRFVEAAGLRWHVQVMGQGPVALLLHGTGGASHSWRDVAPLLAPDFTVIVPDLPGHGFTAMPRRPALSLPNMAAGLGALCAALQAEPEILVGHSAGAAVAAQMALDRRAAPRAIVSFNGAFLPFKGLAGLIFPPMAKALALNPFVPRAFAWGADRTAVDRLLAGFGGRIDGEARAQYRKLFASPGHVAAALGMMANWNLPPLARAMAKLEPFLELVVGETDRTVPPSDAEQIARIVPRVHLTRLAGLGHLAHEEDPDEAASIVRRVAAQTDAPTASQPASQPA